MRAVAKPPVQFVPADKPMGPGNRPVEDGIDGLAITTVLFVTKTHGFGGSEKHLMDLIRRLSGSSVRASILCARADPYTERLARNHLVHTSVRCERGLVSIKHWRRLFRELQPDVVVFINGTLLDLPWYAAVAARLAGVRRLFAIQHLTPPPLPVKVEGWSVRSVVRRMIGWRTRHLLQLRVQPYLCRRTICVSNAVRDSLIGDYRFPPTKTVTIHNGVSASEFAPSHIDGLALRRRLGIPAEAFLLVCVARLSEEKGIDVLLRALSQVLRKGPACMCIIVGDGDLKDELFKQACDLELTGHVIFAGFHEDVLPYLSASNAFVLTSYKEGLPLSMLEAMACGLPCIVTRVGGVPEAIEHGVQGLVVNPGSVEEVAEAISYLLTKPQECERMSHMARAKVREVFDIETGMTELKRLILD